MTANRDWPIGPGMKSSSASPIAWSLLHCANRYGTGRVFHCVLGHDVQALSNPSVQELYRRGTAWAAGFTPVAKAR